MARWVTVEVSGGKHVAGGGASELTLVLRSGLRLEIGRGFDPATLARLVAVLESA